MHPRTPPGYALGLASPNNFSISRAFIPLGFGDVERVELHHFADASESHGYGAASWLRFVSKDGQIHVSFVMGKTSILLIQCIEFTRNN